MRGGKEAKAAAMKLTVSAVPGPLNGKSEDRAGSETPGTKRRNLRSTPVVPMQPTPDFSDHAASVEPNRHKEQTMDSFMDSLQQGGVGLGIQGIQQFQDLFARVGSPEQPSDQNGLLHPDSALRQDQSYFPSPESELAATPKPSKRNTRKRSASVTSYYSDNEDGYQESHTGLVKRGHHAGTPPAGPFHQQPTILILPSISTLSGLPVNLRLLISCSRAFFKEQTEGDWLIYRRNYLELRCAVEAADSLGVATESLSVEVDGERKEVKKLWAEVRAVDGKNQSVELIQGTSTRTGASSSPEPIELAIGGNPFEIENTKSKPKAGGDSVSKVANFYRIVFRLATPNNDSTIAKAGIENTYSLLLDLLGELEDGTLVHLAQCHSSPIVVRGRSPSHYAKMKQKAEQGTIKPRAKPAPKAEGTATKRRKTVEPSPRKEFDSEEDGEGEDIEEWEGSSFAGSRHAPGSTPEFGAVAAPCYSLPAPIPQSEFSPGPQDPANYDPSTYDRLMHIFAQPRSETPPSATENEPRALIDTAAEIAQDLQIDRSASGDQKEPDYPWSPFAFAAKYGLIPPAISTQGSEVAMKDPSSGSSGSASGHSSERLLSAASMFLQSSASLFIDWSGGASATGNGSASASGQKPN